MLKSVELQNFLSEKTEKQLKILFSFFNSLLVQNKVVEGIRYFSNIAKLTY